jgi:hypothetical protein
VKKSIADSLPVFTDYAPDSPVIHTAELEHLLSDAFEADYKHEEWQWKLSDLRGDKH